MDFSFYRLALLLRRQFSENIRIFLFALLTLGALWTVLLFLALIDQGGIAAQREIFRYGTLSGAAALAAYHFYPLSTVPGSIRYLHLPASVLEKIASVFVISMLLYPLAALAVFYAVDFCVIHFLRLRFGSLENALSLYEVVPPETLVGPLRSVLFFLSFLVFSAVYFRRYVFVKSTFALLAIVIGVLLLNQWLVAHWIPYNQKNGWIVNGELFESVQMVEIAKQTSDKISLPDSSIHFFSFFLFYFTPAFAWLLSWFRLRETEVA